MQDEKCAFYIAATEKLSESEKHEIEMDIKTVPFRFVDVGGQRIQRQNGINASLI